MTRSNQERVFGNAPLPENKKENSEVTSPPPTTPTPQRDESPLNFIVPTEMVDLPSRGKFYPEAHPLHTCESIEIRHMTAKEEDILTSSSLLRKGVALDKMLQNVIVDKAIKVEDMLIGDKNALLLYSRIFGYGSDYEAVVTCPLCTGKFNHEFDLKIFEPRDFEAEMVRYEVEPTANNTFLITLPKSKLMVEFRLLTSRDEQKFIGSNKVLGSLELLDTIILSINNQRDRYYIKKAIAHLPIMDASILKKVYSKIMPDIDLIQIVECTHCAEESEMGVPLDASFFWPEF